MTPPRGPTADRHGAKPPRAERSGAALDPRLSAAWSRARDRTRQEIGPAAFESWIAQLSMEGLEEGVVRLGAPTGFIGDWVRRNYGETLLRALRAELPDAAPLTRLIFEVRPPRPAGEAAEADAPAAPAPAEPAPARAASAAATDPGDSPSIPLDPRFTFDRFVVGKPNELAHAAARRVSEGGEVTFNPLFLYSASGLGKTHLMHAIAWRLGESRPDQRVVLLTAEQFMYRFVQALRSRDMIGFKQLFRSVDVLMIDDVQFIAGKDSTQEEFFHTFNALVDQGKQVVISGDRNPVDIDGLEERIRSRLQWGLVVDLHPTDYELRLGILQSKMEMLSGAHPEVEIQPKVLEFLAHRISSNVRVLEGALTRLMAFASLVGRPADMDMAQECLADILRASDRKVTVEEIQRKVAQHYNVRMTDLLSPRRARAVARPRQIAMFLSKSLTSKSLPEIGRRFGGRDHTTVIHACKTIEKLKETDSQMAEDLELLRRMLEA
ncbi:MAG: chromosomal replication initiator protein DnaA [Pseudomonadota bacterium]